MNNQIRKQVHENFHNATKVQFKLISSDNFTYRNILKLIQPYLNRNQNTLDIGCGSGTLSFYLSNKVKSIDGIDISEKAIRICKKTSKLLQNKNTSFDVMDFPYKVPKKHYDLIVCSEVIEHIDNDELALSRIYDLLKKKGIAIISVPSENAPLYKIGFAKEFDLRVGHLRRYSQNELIEKCERAKLHVISTKKTEGVLRNFLFLNSMTGKTIRFIRWFISDIVTYIDNVSLICFGESQIFIVAQKI